MARCAKSSYCDAAWLWLRCERCNNNGSRQNTINLISGAYEITQTDAEIKIQINNDKAINIVTRPEINW